MNSLIKGLINLIESKISNNFVRESYSIDKALWDRYTSNPDFPFLISFPRTGSHWLRNVMELYFEKPSLRRVFFYKNPSGFTCFHIHDEDLLFNEKRRIIYLYRDPVETIFSQMKYYNEDLKDNERIKFWADKYGRHLQKWLLEDNISTEKVILTYEGLKTNFNQEFKKLSDFLNVPFDSSKLKDVHQKTTKEKIKKRVTDDSRVINSTSNYPQKQSVFILKNSALIRQTIEEIDSRLVHFI